MLRDGRFSARLGQEVRLREDPLPHSILNSDPPEHTRLREPVDRIFGAEAFERLAGPIEAEAERLLQAGAEGGALDVIGDFAAPLVVGALAEAMGVPGDDREAFAALTRAAEANLDPLAPRAEQSNAAEAARALHDYLSGQLPRPRADEPNALSELAALAAGGVLSTEEVLTMATLFVIGGHEPTVHLIGNGLLALLLHPDQLGLLRQRPDLIRTAVEELLRYDSPIQFVARVSTDEVMLGETRLEPNQPVVALIGAANRDPAAFPDPDRLDVERRPNRHLSFGGGVHTCLGARFARGIGQVALRTALRRLPTLELATTSLEWRRSHVPRGLSELVVRT